MRILPGQLDPDELRRLLDELVRRLEARGIHGMIRIVGGAALALRFPDDPDVRATRDIDAVYEPREEVDRVIAELADEFGLEVDWINDHAAPWLRVAHADSNPERFEVVVASEEELVAMKLARGAEQDLHDLSILARKMGIDDPEKLVDIAYQIYGEESVELPDGRESYVILARAALDPGPP